MVGLVGLCWSMLTIWVFPKIGFFLPQIINSNRLFHYFHHPFWDTPIFGNTQISWLVFHGDWESHGIFHTKNPPNSTILLGYFVHPIPLNSRRAGGSLGTRRRGASTSGCGVFLWKGKPGVGKQGELHNA